MTGVVFGRTFAELGENAPLDEAVEWVATEFLAEAKRKVPAAHQLAMSERDVAMSALAAAIHALLNSSVAEVIPVDAMASLLGLAMASAYGGGLGPIRSARDLLVLEFANSLLQAGEHLEKHR